MLLFSHIFSFPLYMNLQRNTTFILKNTWKVQTISVRQMKRNLFLIIYTLFAYTFFNPFFLSAGQQVRIASLQPSPHFPPPPLFSPKGYSGASSPLTLPAGKTSKFTKWPPTLFLANSLLLARHHLHSQHQSLCLLSTQFFLLFRLSHSIVVRFLTSSCLHLLQSLNSLIYFTESVVEWCRHLERPNALDVFTGMIVSGTLTDWPLRNSFCYH